MLMSFNRALWSMKLIWLKSALFLMVSNKFISQWRPRSSRYQCLFDIQYFKYWYLLLIAPSFILLSPCSWPPWTWRQNFPGILVCQLYLNFLLLFEESHRFFWLDHLDQSKTSIFVFKIFCVSCFCSKLWRWKGSESLHFWAPKCPSL